MKQQSDNGLLPPLHPLLAKEGKEGRFRQIVHSDCRWLSLVAILLAGGLALPAEAARIHPKAGSTAATFLKIGAGARAVAMGEAFGALADDASAVYWNPAGLVQLTQKEFTAMHDESYQNMRFAFLGYAHPLGPRQALGLSGSGLLLGNDLERRSGVGESIPETPLTPVEGNFGADDLSAALSYAWRPTAPVSFGLTMKALRQRIDQEKGQSLAMDAGLLYQFPGTAVRGAAVLQNFGPGLTLRDQSYDLPMNVKLGLAWRPRPNADVTFDINQPNDNYMRFHMGGEYRPLDFFALRAGLKYRLNGNELGGLSGVSVGGGFKFRGAGVDYAFVPAEDIGHTHRVSLTFRFGSKGGSAAAAPPVRVEDESIPFRLVIKSLKDNTTYQVLAEAARPSDFYRIVFNVAPQTWEDKRLSLFETEPLDNPGGERRLYKMATFTHNFSTPLAKIGLAFRVKRRWLEENGIDARAVSLGRLEGSNTLVQPTSVRAENNEYVSYRADIDGEGPLVIFGTPAAPPAALPPQ